MSPYIEFTPTLIPGDLDAALPTRLQFVLTVGDERGEILIGSCLFALPATLWSGTAFEVDLNIDSASLPFLRIDAEEAPPVDPSKMADALNRYLEEEK